MKIVHYLSHIRLADGGVVRAVLDICTLLAQHGHDIVLITCDDVDVPSEWKDGSDNVPRVVIVEDPGSSGGMLSKAALQTAQSEINSADSVHLHTIWDRANLQLAKLARAQNVPYIITAHGMLDDWSMKQSRLKKRIYHALFLKRLLKNAMWVHCTAAFEKIQASKWFPAERGYVIPLIFDLSPYERLPGEQPARDAIATLDTDQPKILFLSRLHPKKSVEILIDAVDQLRKRGQPLQCYIAGTGEDWYARELQAQAAALDLQESVHFLGLVTGEEKVSLFETCDLFALPTSQENFGFVLVESLACRTPVITTKRVDIWPELEESGGAVIAERSANAFADAVTELLNDDEQRKVMGERGRSWVFDYLDPQNIVRQFEAMYAGRQATGDSA